MKKETVFIDEAPKVLTKYSHAALAGPFVFTSGQTAMLPGKTEIAPESEENIANQTKQTLENLKAVLKAAGCSFEDVLFVKIYITDMIYYKGMNKVYEAYFPEPASQCPARTCVAVKELARPDLLVEIEMIAVKQNSKEI